MAAWDDIARLVERTTRHQLFFVGGAPRSGTTWLQLLLDQHPDISCGGEGLFMKHLAQPLDVLIDARRVAIAEKNTTIFAGMDGYALPSTLDADALLALGVLLALERARGGKVVRALGEKTPENVFFFDRAKRIFPAAKLIVIAREPRDVMASSWHMFYRAEHGGDEAAKKRRMIEVSLPSMIEGTRAMLRLADSYPADVMMLTYEAMLANTQLTAERVFGFLGVDARPEIAASCAQNVAFRKLAGGRDAGRVDGSSFYRQGVVGGWHDTLDAQMAQMVVDALAFSYPAFGWVV